jgi:hypothetical protein
MQAAKNIFFILGPHCIKVWESIASYFALSGECSIAVFEGWEKLGLLFYC